MPRGQLRVSGLLQAAVIALVLGAWLGDTRPGAATATWPFVLAGYAALAAIVPWFAGGLERSDFSVRLSLILALAFALPMALAAYWLHDSAYRALAPGAAALVGGWALHLAAALALYVMRRGDGAR